MAITARSLTTPKSGIAKTYISGENEKTTSLKSVWELKKK